MASCTIPLYYSFKCRPPSEDRYFDRPASTKKIKSLNQKISSLHLLKETVACVTKCALLAVAFIGLIFLAIIFPSKITIIGLVANGCMMSLSAAFIISEYREHLGKFYKIKGEIGKIDRQFDYKTKKNIDDRKFFAAEDFQKALHAVRNYFDPGSIIDNSLCIRADYVYRYTIQGGEERGFSFNELKIEKTLQSNNEQEIIQTVKPWIDLMLFVDACPKISLMHREQICRAIAAKIHPPSTAILRLYEPLTEEMRRKLHERDFPQEPYFSFSHSRCGGVDLKLKRGDNIGYIAVSLGGSENRKYFSDAKEFRESLMAYYQIDEVSKI